MTLVRKSEPASVAVDSASASNAIIGPDDLSFVCTVAQ